MVKIVITHKSVGEIKCLIAAKANNIYIAIKTIPRHNAIIADFFIYAQILGQIIDCSRILSAEVITLPSISVFVRSSVTFCTCASSVSCNCTKRVAKSSFFHTVTLPGTNQLSVRDFVTNASTD